eukprot:scaffold196972_cov21-Prasinocladus_malaysianus.AAC.1
MTDESLRRRVRVSDYAARMAHGAAIKTNKIEGSIRSLIKGLLYHHRNDRRWQRQANKTRPTARRPAYSAMHIYHRHKPSFVLDDG